MTSLQARPEDRFATQQDGIREAVALLRSSTSTLLLAHIHPDADTLGSALAVGMALRDIGRPAVVAVGEDPFVPPRSLAWLPGLDDLVVPVERAPSRPDVAVALDSSSVDRLGLLAPAFEAARAGIVVDHHRTFTGYGHVHIVDGTAAATVLLALELIDALGAPLTQPMATCLYAGLVTDTGSFRFPGTGPDTHLVAARLLAAGVSPQEVSRQIHEGVPIAELRLIATVLARAVLEPAAVGGQGLVHATVMADEREPLGLGPEAVEPIVESLRTIAEAEVAAVLKQSDDLTWRISLRSGGAVDVGAVASGFGGGGHRGAGGYSSVGAADDVLAALRAGLAGAVAPLGAVAPSGAVGAAIGPAGPTP